MQAEEKSEEIWRKMLKKESNGIVNLYVLFGLR